MEHQVENGHDPDNDIRKIIYDCIDTRIVNNTDESVPTYMIINQHGWLGYICEKDGKYHGFLNEASSQFLEHNFGVVSCDTFDECIKALTDMHVGIFHSNWKRMKKHDNSTAQR